MGVVNACKYQACKSRSDARTEGSCHLPWVDISKPDYIAYHDHEWGVAEGGKPPENYFHFPQDIFITHSPYFSPFSKYLKNISLNNHLKTKSLKIVYACKTDGYKMFL